MESIIKQEQRDSAGKFCLGPEPGPELPSIFIGAIAEDKIVKNKTSLAPKNAN